MVREALPQTRKAIVGVAGRPSYPDSLKQEGVVGLCSREESAQAVADKLGVCRPTLYNWRNQLLGSEALSTMKRNKSVPAEREELQRQLESLQRDIRQLQIERDLLKKANELLKKGLGVDLQLLSNREKTLLVDALKDLHRLSELLAQLGLARSSYFYHRARAKLADKYLAVRQSIAEIFELNRRCYGYRRLRASLAKQCIVVSEKVVQRLMRQESLVVARPKRRRYGSYLGEISPAPETSSTAIFRPEPRTKSGLRISPSSRYRLARCTSRPSSTASMAWLSAGPLERIRMPSWSIRCWMPPSRLYRTLMHGPSFILIAVPIIAGQVGYRELMTGS